MKNKKDLRFQVNEFDETFKVKLRNTSKNNYTKEYNKKMKVFTKTCKEIICDINGINRDFLNSKDEDVRERMFVPSRRNKTTNKSFEELSNLKWNTNKRFDITSSIFNKRFITIALMNILEYADTIVDNTITENHSECEFIIQQLINMTESLKSTTNSINSLNTKLLIMKWLISITTSDVNISKYIDTIIEDIESISKLNPISRKANSDFMLHYVLNLGYILTTGCDISKSINYKYIEGFKLGDDCSNYMEYIGEKIKNKGTSQVLQSMIDAKPKILVNKNSSANMINTVYALEITKYLLNDTNKYCTYFINKIER